MAKDRMARVAHVVKEALMEALLRGDVHDPRVTEGGLITITHVEVSADLRYARVCFVVHGGEAESVGEGLAAARGFLRRRVGEALQTRATPELQFVFDEAYEEGQRMERLLAEVAQERHSEHEGGEGDDGS